MLLLTGPAEGAAAATAALQQQGYAVYNPHDGRDVQRELACTGVIFRRGWPQDAAARGKVWLGLPLYYYDGRCLYDMNEIPG